MTISAKTVLDGASVPWEVNVMTGTDKLVSEPLDLGSEVSKASWEVSWTNGAVVTGDFGVEFRNGAGAWIPGVKGTDFFIVGPDVDDNSASVLVDIDTAAGQARLTYLNVSGTGVVNPAVARGKKR